MNWFQVEDSGEAGNSGLGKAAGGGAPPPAPEGLGWPPAPVAEANPTGTGYRRLGNRVSLLPITQFCGLAGALSERYGAGRPAAMSQAFHAWQAGASNTKELLARLTDEEKAEVLGWAPPADVVIDEDSGVCLRYAEALKEIELALDSNGYAAEPGSEALTVGHADMVWVKEVAGMRVAFVGDIKKSVWTTEDGPESLQLHGYGWACARKFRCDAYCPGLWCATEGEWLWAKGWTVLDSDEGQAKWEAIRFAALNRAEASTGEHCRRCYSRLHCPEYMLPVALSQTFLAPFAEGGDLTTLEHSTILKMQALRDALEAAFDQAKAAVGRGAVKIRDPETGKIWGPVMVSGRESVNKEKLAVELGARMREFISKGQPYPQFRWVKPKG